MNIIFFGTAEFAIPSLRYILNSGHKFLTVVTQPDRKKGRHLKLSAPPVKVAASSARIPIYQPQNASSRDSMEYFRNLNAELFVVVSFGQILSKELIGLPRFESINLHGSLLPKYRGAAPVNWAIINGDEKTGVSVIKMNEKMDAGDIILKKEVSIDEKDTSLTLNEKLAECGAQLLLKAIALIDRGEVVSVKQDRAQVSCAPKLKKEDGLIDWSKPARALHNLVRGLIPWPGAYTHFKGKILKIWEAEITNGISTEKGEFGEVIDTIRQKGIIVKAGSGALAIKHLQLEGKKAMDADSFVRGQHIEKGFKFGA